MGETLYVVNADPDLAYFLQHTLELEAFDVRVFPDGLSTLRALREHVPDLMLVAAALPDIDGLEVCRRVRQDPATINLPLMVLSSATRAVDQVAALAAGADECLTVPFDPTELVARVQFTLRRNAEMRAVSPLTGLPGNHRIEVELALRIAAGGQVAVCYADLDHFKAFNDCYGFLRGDEVLLLLSNAIKTAAGESADPAPFVGHVGGDDFVVICTPEQVETLCQRIVDIFDAAVPQLHDAADVARGHLSVVDRQGHVREYPLVGVSIGVATSERRRFRDHRDAVAIATEMKVVAKGEPGSAIAIDRRSDPATAHSH